MDRDTLTPVAPPGLWRRAPWAWRRRFTDALGLPLTAAAQWVAWDGIPAPAVLAWTALAVAGALLAAAATNRLLDGAAAGERRSAQLRRAGGAVLGAAALLTAAHQLHGGALLLSPLPVLGMVLYPSLRRWTWAHPAAWGALQALGPLWAWVAVRGAAEGPAWLLAGATGLWLSGSVVLQDLAAGPPENEEDRPSPTQALGPERALAVAGGAHGAAVALWTMAGWASGRDGWYFAALALCAVLLAWRHRAAARCVSRGLRLPRVGVADGGVALAMTAGMVLDVLR